MSGAPLDFVGAYYTARLAEHGPTPRGVDWNGTESQRLRHAQFLRLFAHEPQASLLDLGCGYGDFLGFLREGGHTGHYAGWDVAAAMVEAARAQHGEGPAHSFHVGDGAGASAEYAVASGILNVKGDQPEAAWAGHVKLMIEQLARMGRRGFGFNVLSLSSDPDRRRAHLHYADPAATLRFCLDRFGRHVALLQDYGLWEFTVLVRHEATGD